MRERTAFGVASALILLGVGFVAYGVFLMQFGPDWEVPAAAATIWDSAGVVAVILCLVAGLCYLRGNRFQSLDPRYRNIFWTLLFVGLLIAILNYALQPAQWQRTHPLLSVVLRVGFIPITVPTRWPDLPRRIKRSAPWAISRWIALRTGPEDKSVPQSSDAIKK
jgi:hypothetical protein